MKLSFSLPPNMEPKVQQIPVPNSKDVVGEDNLKEFITEYDTSNTLNDSKPKNIIPPLEDTWKKNHTETEPDLEGFEKGKMLLLRKQLESLPDDSTLEDYEKYPVEGFGARLLAGYGWKPGQGIGRKAKEDVPTVQYKKWHGKNGVGFKIEST